MIRLLKTSKENIIDFYDFYGELIKKDQKFTLGKCYHLTREKASKILNPSTLMQMDTYLLNNFVFKKEERLITSFKSVLKRNLAIFDGHLFLTQKRFLGTGAFHEKPSSSTPYMMRSMRQNIKKAKRDREKKVIKKTLDQNFYQDFNFEDLYIFSFSFPIMNARKIERGKKKISYLIPFEYINKKKMKKKIINFKIIPQKEKGETSLDFNRRVHSILDIIEKTLRSNQGVQNS